MVMRKILRLRSVLDASGDSRSGLYKKIQNGTYVPPINLSLRSVGWPSNEVDAINAARIAGKTETEIRELVAVLVLARKNAA